MDNLRQVFQPSGSRRRGAHGPARIKRMTLARKHLEAGRQPAEEPKNRANPAFYAAPEPVHKTTGQK